MIQLVNFFHFFHWLQLQTAALVAVMTDCAQQVTVERRKSDSTRYARVGAETFESIEGKPLLYSCINIVQLHFKLKMLQDSYMDWFFSVCLFSSSF